MLGAIRLRHTSPAGALKPINDRKPLPAFSLPLLDGGTWSLADHRGQVVLINYWATWCEPCQEETPALLRTADTYEAAQFAIVGVSFDAGPDASTRVHQYISRFHVPYAIALSTEPWTTGVSQIALPTTVLVDRHGRIARTYAGPVSAGELARDIAGLLAES